MTALVRLLRDESGATAIEYGLLVALVGIPLLYGMQGIASGINDTVMRVYSVLYQQNNVLFNLNG